MSKLKKALQKANEDRDFESQQKTQTGLDHEDELNIRPGKESINFEGKCAELDVCYTQTKVKKIDDRLMKKGKIYSLFHEYKITDQIKSIRTQIINRLKEVGGNTLMVTSSNPGEGKTFTAINLGVSIAHELNKSVLLIDADLRKPAREHKNFSSDFFRTRINKGLSDYLLNGVQIPELLINPGIERLVLLPGGKFLANSAEYLGSTRMEIMIKEMKNRYADERIIIIDTPSMLTSADALVISKYVDGILLVIEENRTTADQLKTTMQLLEDRPVFGSVINKVK
jgi:non-specific protein-tyrosine kinase